MKQAILLSLVAAGLALGLLGCENRAVPPASPPPDEAAAPEAPASGLSLTGILATVQIRTAPLPLHGPVAVDSRSMKSLFPRRIGTLKLKSVVHETFPREPQPEAMAKAQYESPLGGRAQVTITDFGRPREGLETRYGLTWLAVHIDRETDRGYERDGRQGLFRYYETFNRNGNFGQISVLWNNRLLIELEGYRLPDGRLLQALQAINWGQALAPGTARSAPLSAPEAPSESP